MVRFFVFLFFCFSVLTVVNIVFFLGRLFLSLDSFRYCSPCFELVRIELLFIKELIMRRCHRRFTVDGFFMYYTLCLDSFSLFAFLFFSFIFSISMENVFSFCTHSFLVIL